VQAFVLIQTRVGENGNIAAALRELPGIESTDDLTGPYDVIAVASAASTRELYETIVAGILAIPGVTHALPAPLVRSPSRPAPAEEAA
jgi:DNA-binding Lrp family transcriptional regulator